MEIGDRLKKIREDKGLSQGDFAKFLNISQQNLSNYEKNKRDIPEHIKIKLQQNGVNLNWLISGNGEQLIKNAEEPVKSALIQEIEKIAEQATLSKIKEQEQELINLKVKLENLIQEKEYLKQEERLAKVENQQEELYEIYNEMYDTYYNSPKDNRPRRIIQRGMGAKGIVTEKTGILYPDGTFIEDSETVQEASPVYTADYKEPEEVIELPLVLSLAAGIPIEAIDINETYPVPKSLIKKNKKYCVAKIAGTSMTDAGIKDGSYVLLEYSNNPVNGQIMAVKHGTNTTLKLLHLTEAGDWQLLYQDGSGAIIPLKTGDWEAQGKFITVL